MKKLIAISLALLPLSTTAFADALTFYDGNGTKTVIQTNTLTGCVSIYDSGRNPLQICRLRTAPAPAAAVVVPAPATTVVVPAPATTVVTPAPVAVAPNAWDRRQDRATARRVIRRTEARQDLFD